MIQPDPEVLEIIREIVRKSGGAPARMHGFNKRNGDARWILMKGGMRLDGSSQQEILRKLYMITFEYGWK